MSNDTKTTILGVLSAICSVLVTVFPGALGDMLKTVVGAIGAICIALWAYFTNKGTPVPPTV